jgi:hypothetical protein
VCKCFSEFALCVSMSVTGGEKSELSGGEKRWEELRRGGKR